MSEIQHASDCAVHNAPALRVGECDCGAELSRLRTLLSTLMEAVEPFAEMDDEGIEDLADDTPIEVRIGKRAGWFHLKVSDLRALTGAYLKAKGE